MSKREAVASSPSSSSDGDGGSDDGFISRDRFGKPAATVAPLPVLPTFRRRRASSSSSDSDLSASSDSSSEVRKPGASPKKAAAAAVSNKGKKKKKAKAASDSGNDDLDSLPIGYKITVDDDSQHNYSQDSYDEEIAKARLVNAKHADFDDPLLRKLNQANALSKRTQARVSHEARALRVASSDEEASARPAVKLNLPPVPAPRPFAAAKSDSDVESIEQDEDASSKDGDDETGFLIMLRHGSKEIEARCRPQETLQMVLDRCVPDLASKAVKLDGKTLDKSKQWTAFGLEEEDVLLVV